MTQLHCPHCSQPKGGAFPPGHSECPRNHDAIYAPCPFCCPAAYQAGICARWIVVSDKQIGTFWEQVDARLVPDVAGGRRRYRDLGPVESE